MSTHPTLLRRQMASQYLRERHSVVIAPATLAKLACLGGGPRFRKFNNVPLYEAAELDAWVESRLTRPLMSTSDTAGQKDTCDAR